MAPSPERPELITSSPVSYSLHTLWCFSRPQETKHTCWGARSLTYNHKFRYYISSSHTHTHTSHYSAWHLPLYNYYFKAMCLWYNFNLSFFSFLNTGPPETLCGLWPRILHATLFFLNRKSNRRHLYHTVHSVPSPTTKRRKCALHNNQTKLI